MMAFILHNGLQPGGRLLGADEVMLYTISEKQAPITFIEDNLASLMERTLINLVYVDLLDFNVFVTSYTRF
jgi:hypothetical protein